MEEKFWEEKENELEELKQLRLLISQQIHLLQCEIRQHKKGLENPPDKTNTIAWQMFGKRLKDLTAEEYRIYYNTRQKETRKDRKKGN